MENKERTNRKWFTKNVMLNIMILFFLSIQNTQCTLIDMASGNEEESQVTASKESSSSSSLYSLFLLNSILSSSRSYSFSTISPNCTSASKSCTYKINSFNPTLTCFDTSFYSFSYDLCTYCSYFSTSGTSSTQYSDSDCKGFGYTEAMKSSSSYNCFYNGTASSLSYQPCNSTIKTNFFSADKTPPQISSTYPTNNASSVSTFTDILIYLSEEIDTATVSTANVILKKSGTTVPVYSVSYLFSNNAIQIPYYSSGYILTSASSYTVTVTTNVKDMAGNALKSEYTFSFTTQ